MILITLIILWVIIDVYRYYKYLNTYKLFSEIPEHRDTNHKNIKILLNDLDKYPDIFETLISDLFFGNLTLENMNYDDVCLSLFELIGEFDEYKDEIKFLTEIDIKKSKHEENRTWFDDTSDGAQIFWNRVYARKTYEDTYVNITTESCYSPKEIHITEKSMKPFYFYQFPIFLASYNHVKYLKDRFKFDMFDDIISHDYDDEPDNRIRMHKVITEIKRMYENKEFFMEFYKNNKERFDKNRQKVFDIYNSKNDVNFFKSLTDVKIDDYLNLEKKII